MVNVLKANGETELFMPDKLLASIKRAGIPEPLQPQVMAHIKDRLHENITTAEIYRHILEFLEKSPEPFNRARYSLKQSIMELGPTGYPFEDYIGKLLEKLGYTARTRTILQGTCVTHEVDVIAEKKTVLANKILVEAKFHNTVGLRTTVHVPMYTKARFDDVKERHEFTEVWVITNTKATIDAIAYAQCVGMKIITWSFPEGESLRDLVEKYHLFPITAITAMSTLQKQELLQKGVVLCEDLAKNIDVLDDFHIDHHRKSMIFDECNFIMKSSFV